MNLALFEALATLVILLTLGTMAKVEYGRGQGLAAVRRLLATYAILAVAGWVGEETSITFYQHYRYAPEWHARVLDVPLLVPLIWPLVILSARAVRDALFPTLQGLSRATVLGTLVVIDASLMEVLATRAGLWSWAEGGYLDVPLLGILAWGLFAGAADALLERLDGWGRLLTIPAAVVVAHALICMVWWYGLKWVLREDIGVLGTLLAVLYAVVVSALAFRWRRRRTLPPHTVWPRVSAALVFVALFLSSAATSWPHWLHLIAIAIPYCLLTDWRALVTTFRPPRAAAA